ncbi:glycosyltransferase family 2 protein [soil metagenome]
MKLQKRHYTNYRTRKPANNDTQIPSPVNTENPENPVQNRNQNLNEKRPVNNNYPLVTIIIPLLNEEESLNELSVKIEKVFSDIKYNYEVLFIDDGSTDRSFEVIKDIHRRNQKFHCIKLRRNYGKSSALGKGFRAAKGSIVITMDADLQDDPGEIPELISVINSGYDLVSGWKKVRYDPFIKKHTSKFFNYVTSKLSGIRLHDFNCGLKAYKRDVVKSIRVYGEMHRYIPAIAHMAGFKVTEKVVKHQARKYGVTKFGANRFLNGFFDVLTLSFNHRFIKNPLHFFGFIGLSATSVGILITLYLTLMKYLEDQSISGRPLFFVGIFLIIIGIQFFSIGLLAEMITKTNVKDDDVLIEKIF